MGVKQHRSRMNLYNRENVDILQKHLTDKSCEKFIDDTQHLNIMDDSAQHMLFLSTKIQNVLQVIINN